MQCTSVKTKYRETSMNLYGVPNPMQVPDIKNKNINNMRKTFMERYGVMYPLQVKRIADIAHKKAFETFALYGANSPAKMPGARSKIDATNVERYGFRSPFQNKEIIAKSLKTKEAKGINLFKKTKIEARILEALNRLYPSDDIKHPYWFEGHPVDFYIPSIDTWIEHDGDFWHGLIPKWHQKYPWTLERFLRDRKQDERFSDLGMNLIRITYSEVKKLTDNELDEFLRNRIT